MVVFEMVTIITVVAILAGLVKEWIKRREFVQVDMAGLESRLHKVESLEERIRILEAIVTDKGYDLKREIDNLK